MPYCPKCDMEFVDGVTVCTDCGAPLFASREEALDANKQEAKNRRLDMLKELYYHHPELFTPSTCGEEESEAKEDMTLSEEDLEEMFSNGIPEELASYLNGMPIPAAKSAAPDSAAPKSAPIYVKKSDRYEDLKSSASAFIGVGSILLVFSALCWIGVIKLPMNTFSKYMFQTVMTVMGIASLIVAKVTNKSAKTVEGQIDEELQYTRQLTDWFLSVYSSDYIDNQILAEHGELVPEELALRRFEYIQDYLITGQDIPDQSFADAMTEEIYGKLYEN